MPKAEAHVLWKEFVALMVRYQSFHYSFIYFCSVSITLIDSCFADTKYCARAQDFMSMAIERKWPNSLE